ncbi:MAG: radical SAM protein [Candidatus Woesearchaeota archaeon]
MTRDCNLNCKYCFMLEKDKYKGERLDFDLFKQIIDKIVKQRVVNNLNQTLHLVFHGGEPLLLGKEKFRQFLEYIKTEFDRHGLKYSLGMQTNATLLDDEFAQILNKYNMSVGLSFDGIADSNKQRTDIKQQIFEDKFEILEKNDVNYGFLLVVGKHNINNMGDSQKYLKNLESVNGFKANYAEDFFNYGSEDSIELSGEEFFEKVMKPEVEEFTKTGKIYEHHTKEVLYRTIVDILTQHENNAKAGCGSKFCGAVISMIGVNPDGTSHYCDRYSKEFPETFVMNNLDYDFHGIHQLKEAVNYNLIRDRVIRNTGCDTCYAQYICEGGCMAMYYSKHGEYGLDKNLVCGQYKNFYKYVLKNLENILTLIAKHEHIIDSKDKIFNLKTNMKSFLNQIGLEATIDKDNRHLLIIKEKK